MVKRAWLLTSMVLSGVSMGANVYISSGDCVHGNGESRTETRSVGAFSAVDANGAFSIQARIAKESTLSVTADSNLLSLIATEVSGGKLRVYTRKSICTSGPLNVILTTPELSEIAANGSNNIAIGDYRGRDLRVRLDGSNDVKIDGQSSSVRAEISGASTFDGRALRVGSAEISVVGAGTAYVNAADNLGVSIVGAGDVYYAGSPKRITRNVMGVGTIAPIP